MTPIAVGGLAPPPCSLAAAAEIELGQLQVAGLGNLQINLRAVDDGDGMSGTLDDGGLVCAEEAVGGSLSEGALEEAEAETLGSLGEDDEFAGDGGGDERAVGGALDLLDGIDGGQADDGRAELGDGVDGAVDGGRVDQGADGIVDEDQVVGLGGQRGEGVGDGLLAAVSAFDDVDAGGEAGLGGILGDLGLDAIDLRSADGDVDGGDARDGGEGAQGMDEDGLAAEREELLGLGAGHAGSETSSRKNDEYLHNSWSIALREDRDQGSGGRDLGSGRGVQRGFSREKWRDGWGCKRCLDARRAW